MDTTATVTDIDPTTGAASEKTDSPGTAATETDASGNAEQAGGERSTTEGGGQDNRNGRSRGPTKLDTIRELRQKLRERDQLYETNLQALQSQIEELKGMVSSGHSGQKLSKSFFDAPEETTKAILQEELKALKEELFQGFQQTRQQDQATLEWSQETSQAAEFIKNQKGITPEDEADIIEIIQSIRPQLRDQMRPMERAEYALLRWQKERGISDTSALRAKASGVPGSGTSRGGPRIWTEPEIEAELNKFPHDPKNWTPEQNKAFDDLNAEIKRAFQENRVKK